MFGPVHFHEDFHGAPARVSEVTGPMASWQDFRRVNHVADSGIRVHDHTRLGRHHHDAADPSIVVVGAGDHDDATDGALSGAAIVLIAAPSASLAVALPHAIGTVRPPVALCTFASCDQPRLDKPPIV